MANLNRTTLIGRLGHDPELRYTTGGTAVASFTLATREKVQNKLSGEMEDRTEWHNIVLWDKLAEIATEHLAKGRTIYLEGRLQSRPLNGRTKLETHETLPRLSAIRCKYWIKRWRLEMGVKLIFSLYSANSGLEIPPEIKVNSGKGQSEGRVQLRFFLLKAPGPGYRGRHLPLTISSCRQTVTV